MANCSENTNASQFYITFAPADWLDGHHVVFGKVVKGQELCLYLSQWGNKEGKVHGKVEILYCGEVKEDYLLKEELMRKEWVDPKITQEVFKRQFYKDYRKMFLIETDELEKLIVAETKG